MGHLGPTPPACCQTVAAASSLTLSLFPVYVLFAHIYQVEHPGESCNAPFVEVNLGHPKKQKPKI